MTKARAPSIHAVIIAGGAGERFWPASRRARPKPFLEVIGGETLLDATLARARRFAGPDRVWIVCGSEHASAVRRESGLAARRILVEPERRNTAAAVAWAALRIAAEDPEAVLAVLPADHHVPDARAFESAVRRGARAARDADVLVTFGVKPTRPETGYGYIQVGAPAGRGHAGLREVKRFVEKPDLPTARRYLRHGDYLWNAGVFVWSARVFLEEIERHAPDLHRAFAPLRRRPRGRDRDTLHASYRRAPSLPVDVAVLERSDRVWTLPLSFAWSDVGTWDSLAEEIGVGQHARAGAPGENRVLGGDVLLEDASGNLVWGGRRLVALLGVSDLAVIDTDDVIFVTQLASGVDVRRMVAALKARGREDLT